MVREGLFLPASVRLGFRGVSGASPVTWSPARVSPGPRAVLPSRLGLRMVKIAVLSTHALPQLTQAWGRGESLADCEGHAGHSRDKRSQY